MRREEMESDNQNPRVKAIAVGIISFSVIAFEIVLTRIFSVVLSYHYVFAILSFALLGLGAGALSLGLWRRSLPGIGVHVTSLIFSIAILFSTLIIIKFPPEIFSILPGFTAVLYSLTATAPFFFAGLTMAWIFELNASRMPLVYGFDLLGGTAAAAIAVILLNNTDGFEAVTAVAVIASLASLMLWFRSEKRSVISLGLALLFVFSGSLLLGLHLHIDVPVAGDPDKDLVRVMDKRAGDEIVETRWSAFGRTDLLRKKDNPAVISLFVDGAAGTPMYNLKAIAADSSNGSNSAVNMFHSAAIFPFLELKENQKDTALIIGPGGGRDVVMALLGGIKQIIAVEVNPDIVALVKKYREFNGGIYTDLDNVNVIVGEGRNYIRSHNKKYDLIMLSIPITKSSRSVEGFMLTESYLFTVEAFGDYLDHLTPDGRLVIVAHDHVEIFRLINLVAAAMRQRGIDERQAMSRIYTVSAGMMPTLVIAKQPFVSLAVQARQEKMDEYGFNHGHVNIPLLKQVMASPVENVMQQREMRDFNQMYDDLADGKFTIAQLAGISAFDMSLATDDSPFFYKFRNGLPEPLSLFLVMFIAAAVLLELSMAVSSDTGLARNGFLAPVLGGKFSRHFLLIACLLGFGFMLIEVALFQKLILYFGHPAAALSVLLFSLLLGTGIGSLASVRVAENRVKASIVASALAAGFLVGTYTFMAPLVTRLWLNNKLVPIVILISLGLVMGVPFPGTVRLMDRLGYRDSVHVIWGANGIASVLGAAMAMVIGVGIGFSYALYAGAAAYLLTAAAGGLISVEESDEHRRGTIAERNYHNPEVTGFDLPAVEKTEPPVVVG